jgi:tetratricopeptide (TPR) repeat protein
MGTRGRATKTLVLMMILLCCAISTRPAWTEDYLDYYEHGEFALRVGKWQSAIDWFTKSIQDNPNFFVAYHNRAVAYSKVGEYDKSIEDLKKAVQLNPDYPDAYGLMGLVYEIKEDYPSALKVYRQALSRGKQPSMQKLIEKYIKDVEAKIQKK